MDGVVRINMFYFLVFRYFLFTKNTVTSCCEFILSILGMFRTVISVIVLVGIKPSFPQNICDNPWRKDLGLTGSEIKLENLFRIQREFLNKNYTITQHIKTDLEKCNMSSECRVYTVMDKEVENAIILCIMVDSIPNCYALNCSCEREKDRIKRAINSPNSHVASGKEGHGRKVDLKTVKCKISVVHENFLPVSECITTTAKQDTSYSNDGTNLSICGINCSSKGNVLVGYFWLFPLGSVFGALIGVVVTCVWFQRKTSSSINNPKHIGEKNANEEHGLLDGADYPEIPGNLPFFEISSKERNEKQAVQHDANLKNDKVFLPTVQAEKNKVKCQKEISIQMRNPNFDSKTVKECDVEGSSNSTKRGEECEKRCVYETCIENDDVTMTEKKVLPQNVDPGKPEYVYHMLEDIPKDDRDKVPAQWSEKEMEYPCVSETCGDNADVRIEQKESQDVNLVKPCNIYYTVEDIRNVEQEEGGNETPAPTSTSKKSPVTEALYFVLSTQASLPIAKSQNNCGEKEELCIPDA